MFVEKFVPTAKLTNRFSKRRLTSDQIFLGIRESHNNNYYYNFYRKI